VLGYRYPILTTRCSQTGYVSTKGTIYDLFQIFVQEGVRSKHLASPVYGKEHEFCRITVGNDRAHDQIAKELLLPLAVNGFPVTALFTT
jgi:hypothetical protein